MKRRRQFARCNLESLSVYPSVCHIVYRVLCPSVCVHLSILIVSYSLFFPSLCAPFSSYSRSLGCFCLGLSIRSIFCLCVLICSCAYVSTSLHMLYVLAAFLSLLREWLGGKLILPTPRPRVLFTRSILRLRSESYFVKKKKKLKRDSLFLRRMLDAT